MVALCAAARPDALAPAAAERALWPAVGLLNQFVITLSIQGLIVGDAMMDTHAMMFPRRWQSPQVEAPSASREAPPECRASAPRGGAPTCRHAEEHRGGASAV